MKAERDAKAGPRTTPPVPPTVGGDHAAMPAPEVTTPVAAAAQPEGESTPAGEASQSARDSGKGLRTLGIAAAAVGVLGVATGITFGALSHGIQGEVESDGRKGIYDPDKDQRGRTYGTVQWVGYGIGAAALAGGTVLYVLGWKSARQDSPVPLAVVPAVSQSQAGLALQGRY
jgi:hypothetical protein